MSAPHFDLTDLDLYRDYQYQGSTGCLYFGAADLTLDCNGHNISGTDAAGTQGIDTGGYDGVTIKNFGTGGAMRATRAVFRADEELGEIRMDAYECTYLRPDRGMTIETIRNYLWLRLPPESE